jgi:hypothetical protein
MPSRRTLLGIGGFRVALDADVADFAFAVPDATRPFLIDSGPPDAVVTARWADLSLPPPGEPIFDAGVLWKLYRDGEVLEFRFTSPAFGGVPYKIARFTDRFTRGEVLLHRAYFQTVCPYPLEYPLDELLVVHLLTHRGGIELHGCGVVDETGAGYLFCGQSGAGKSTIAGLWRGRAGTTVLSDDRIVLREEHGRIRMHGTPWHGEALLAAPRDAPLTAVHLLEQASIDRVRSLEAAEAAARLFACAFVPFYSADALSASLGVLHEIAARVPCGVLSFAPGQGAIDAVRLATRAAN